MTRAPSMFASAPARASLALTGALAFLIGFNLVGAHLQHRAEARVVTRLMLRDGLQPLPPTSEELFATMDHETGVKQ